MSIKAEQMRQKMYEEQRKAGRADTTKARRAQRKKKGFLGIRAGETLWEFVTRGMIKRLTEEQKAVKRAKGNSGETLRRKAFVTRGKWNTGIVPAIIIFIGLSYTGWKDYKDEGLWDQRTHEAMTVIGKAGLSNSGVVWYGVYSYFNDNYVTDLMYKTRDCRGIESRGKFYPGHNKYDFRRDTVDYIIGKLWKPSEEEKKWLTEHYTKMNFAGIEIYKKIK